MVIMTNLILTILLITMHKIKIPTTYLIFENAILDFV